MIDAIKVNEIFLDSLFREEELSGSSAPENAVLVQGIVERYGFHPGRLEQHREQVRAWLAALPDQFQISQGGGWSFLNACHDREGRWTDLHQRMDQLFCLGLGLKLVVCLMPRESWAVLPGGMPYYAVRDSPASERGGEKR